MKPRLNANEFNIKYCKEGNMNKMIVYSIQTVYIELTCEEKQNLRLAYNIKSYQQHVVDDIDHI